MSDTFVIHGIVRIYIFSSLDILNLLPLSKGSFQSVFKLRFATSSQISYNASPTAGLYFVGFILALSSPETLGTFVSESYEVRTTDSSFSSHFALPQEGKQPLYGQRDYSNKLYICHKAKSDKGQKCQYATIYDTHYKIPLISAKKYTSQPLNTSERSDWTFNGGLKKIGERKEEKEVWPTANYSKTIYAEKKEDTPTLGEIDRGHLFANSLRFDDFEAMATFSLYNVVPQFAYTNRGHWKSSLEAHPKKSITNCLKDMKEIQEAAFYLVAGTRDYNTLNYSCVDCTVNSVWNFDGRAEANRFKMTETCCKVISESSSRALAFRRPCGWLVAVCIKKLQKIQKPVKKLLFPNST